MRYSLAAAVSMVSVEVDVFWERVYAEYVRWRSNDVDAVAGKYLDRKSASPLSMPLFDTPEWWACMIHLRLRNLDLTQRKHVGGAFDAPSTFSQLPRTVGIDGTAPSTSLRMDTSL